MAKIAKQLTGKNGLNYGFDRAEEYDFRDDGAGFKGYTWYYKLPLTQHRSREYGTFLCVRVDYLETKFMKYKELKDEWYNSKEFTMCDEFNGVDEIDIERLNEICQIVWNKVQELEAKAEEFEIKMDECQSNVIDEVIAEVETKVNEMKGILAEARTLDFWKLKSYELSTLTYNLKWLNDRMDYLEKNILNVDKIDVVLKADLIYNFKKYGNAVDCEYVIGKTKECVNTLKEQIKTKGDN